MQPRNFQQLQADDATAAADAIARAVHFEDLLNRRAAKALPRRFTGESITDFGCDFVARDRRFAAEPVSITGFGALQS